MRGTSAQAKQQAQDLRPLHTRVVALHHSSTLSRGSSKVPHSSFFLRTEDGFGSGGVLCVRHICSLPIYAAKRKL